MREHKLSQSRLARDVGTTQATIYKILKGEITGTRFLHRIARRVGSTPAYLTGETDDPKADAPDAPFISPDETELLECFRVMTPVDRKSIMQIACSLAGRYAQPATFHAPGQAFHHEGGKR